MNSCVKVYRDLEGKVLKVRRFEQKDKRISGPEKSIQSLLLFTCQTLFLFDYTEEFGVKQ